MSTHYSRRIGAADIESRFDQDCARLFIGLRTNIMGSRALIPHDGIAAEVKAEAAGWRFDQASTVIARVTELWSEMDSDFPPDTYQEQAGGLLEQAMEHAPLLCEAQGWDR